MILIFDTETTGFPVNAPVDDPRQPHVCQLGFIAQEGNRVVGEGNFIIKPTDIEWEIPERVAEIHGISTEMALKHGVALEDAMGFFMHFARRADTIVAHNIQFDLKMWQFEASRLDILDEVLDICQGGGVELFDTMVESKDICKIPPTARQRNAGFGGYKNPNMQEAHVHFFGKEFEGAHDAMADVRACRDVYFAIKEHRFGDSLEGIL